MAVSDAMYYQLRDERDHARQAARTLMTANDVLLADAARWKAEAERLREDMKHALMVADETASMQCECDGYYRCGSCPTRIANRAEDVAEILQRSLDNDWGSALSAGGGTDAKPTPGSLGTEATTTSEVGGGTDA